MKIIFMGTPNFAVRILQKLVTKHEVVLVVTQPDSYNQRKKAYIPTPVKEFALKLGIEVFQPEKIKLEQDKILNKEADFIVTAAYGQIIPKSILKHPKYLPINVHGSLLPKYRGGAPIQRSIINGDHETGITIMIMSSKMDAGDILAKKAIPIKENDNQDTIFEELSILGSEMILDVIDGIIANTISPIPQDDSLVTYAYNLNKEDEKIDFVNKTASEVFNQIRGLNSNPGAYFSLDGVDIKVYNSRVSTISKVCNKKISTIVAITKDSIDISCKDNTIISITEIQMPSKKRTLVRDYLNGNRNGIFTLDKEIV